jgi:TatD DNase family protein
MEFFDTHTHMYLNAFSDDLGACMERASANGVRRIALPNIDSASIEQVQTLMAQYPERILGMMGLHPCSVKENWEEELGTIEAALNDGGYHAVGEIGIDLYWDRNFQKEQVQAFKVQIGWAKSRNLPIVIHARDAFDEICTVLDEVHDADLSGIFHCFTGSVDEARRALAFPNFYLGIGGVLTFKNGGLDKVVTEMGVERMVLETDAPYLAPSPFRGKRNETAYTRIVAEKMAELTGLPLEEIARITTANAEKIFQLNEQ